MSRLSRYTLSVARLQPFLTGTAVEPIYVSDRSLTEGNDMNPGTDDQEIRTGAEWLSAPLRSVAAINADRRRACTEHVFRSWDCSDLFYRQWPARETAHHAVILIH